MIVSVETTEVDCDFSGADWLCGWTDVSEGANHWTPAPTGYTGNQYGTYSLMGFES